MHTDIDLVFDSLLRESDPPAITPAPGKSARVARYPLALILEEEMRRRARFLDSMQPGPLERWPLASPAHLIDELEDIAKRLKALTSMRHTVALERAARSAGYWSWQHAKDEQKAFEATSGEAFRSGFVIATIGEVAEDSGFVADQGLLFLAAKDLVHEYGATDGEGGWYQLATPSVIGGGAIDDTPHFASRQLLLREVGASYWQPNFHVASFFRFDGEQPQTLQAALKLAKSSLNGGELNYVWLRGAMHTVSDRWN